MDIKQLTYLNSISHQSSKYSITVKCAEQNCAACDTYK